MLLHAGASLHGHEHSKDRQPTAPKPSNSGEDDDRQTFLDQEMESDTSTPKSRPLSLQSYIPGFTYMSSLLSPPLSFADFPECSYFAQPHTDHAGSNTVTSIPKKAATAPATPRDSGVSSVRPDEKEFDNSTISTIPSSPDETPVQRPTARFALCQRPATRRKSFRKSRDLLQLRRADDKHILPVLDVYLASHLPDASHHTKLGTCLPRIFGAKLDPHDIVLMRSAYDTKASFLGPEKNVDESHKHLEVLAAICPLGEAEKHGAFIALDDGSIWVGTQRTNGSFEFVKEDAYGDRNAVRWIRRTSKMGTDYFNFCVVDSEASSWPIQGVLNKGSLDVYGSYSKTALATRPLSSQSVGALEKPAHSIKVAKRVKTVHSVSEYHQRLMTITAVWVSFCQSEWPGDLPRVTSCCPVSRGSRPKQPLDRPRSKSESVSSSEGSMPASRSTGGLSSICGSERSSMVSGRIERRASAGAAYMQRKRSTREPTPLKHEAEATKSKGKAGRMKQLAQKVLR